MLMSTDTCMVMMGAQTHFYYSILHATNT